MNILIVKLSAIGDVIHALPVARALREGFPSARITWAVEPPARPLLVDNPNIDEILLFEKARFKSFSGFFSNFFPFRRKLREGGFDVALDLQGLGKSAAIAFFSGAGRRLGTADMRELSDWVSQPVRGPHADGHIVERYLDVARALGCSVAEGRARFDVAVSAEEERSARAALVEAGVPEGTPYAVLAPGANWPNKRWPSRHYAIIGDWLYGLGIIPVFVGGGVVDERIFAEAAEAAEIPPVSVIGKTSLKELAAILRGARGVLGGDTGPVHLSAGLGVPTVMLMGPTDAVRNGPYGQGENAIEVKRPCRWCWKRACPKKLDCLAAITPAEAKERMKAAMEKGEKQP